MGNRLGVVLVLALAPLPARAQITGSIAQLNCGALITDARGALGELYVMKTHNPGTGPDAHTDWAFDLSAKGGGATTGCDAGGASWTVADTFHQMTTPPEEMFMVMTFPGGWVAIDSLAMRGMPDSMGVVQRQHVGDSLPVGTAAGIGLVLPGDARPYTVAGLTDRRTGNLAQFPYGTATGIEVAFAPVAELNSATIGGSGCTIGGDVPDQYSGGGLIAGYNVYRVPGVPGIVPTPADFMGNWQYYIDLLSFDLNVPDTAGVAGPDLNNDGLPDGDGTPAPNDSAPDDLAGLHNPDGLPYTGDEVLLFQDSPLNPDRTPRASGTGPDLTGGQGYWYAFQPVLYQGATRCEDWDGLGFTRDDEFLGVHAVDTEGDGVFESLDVDVDGRIDFYGPQIVTGQTGLGLTNRELPVLSSPVYARVNPAPAIVSPRLGASFFGSRVVLLLETGLETADVLGYEVRRLTSSGERVALAPGLVASRGGEGNVYRLTDRLATSDRREGTRLTYEVDVVLDGGERQAFGPFTVALQRGIAVRARR